MSLVALTTNVELNATEAKKFILEFSKFCAETIRKPEAELCVEYNYTPYLTFGGTFDPAFRLTVVSLWNTTPDNSVAWSRAFFKFFEEKLGVLHDRGHIAYTEPGDEFIGYKGTSVAALVYPV